MRHLNIVVILLILLSSCSVQKRRYLKGYYFNRQTTAKTQVPEIKKAFSPLQKNEVSFPCFASDSLPELKKTNPSTKTIRETVCDTLILSSGVKMVVKVTDINKDKIHYLLCDSDNEAEFFIETPKVTKITFANGTYDDLKNPKDAPYDYTHGQNTNTFPQNNKNPELERARKNATLSLALVLGGLLFGPVMIAGFILAAFTRKKLMGKRGYESSYKLVNVLTIIGAVFLVFLIIIMISLLALLI